ncbi:hypothetical protein PoB_000120800 [Plakobranchus ocellatus]|uniref:Uncharacterized protein n=1 Tax=Plakobranchus ocellatus TaxID=259542 RepID=A0AAV3XWG9_9GAST|nr:hypothetical protein PoB_000120800 [Plakobranchus ocellatus]
MASTCDLIRMGQELGLNKRAKFTGFCGEREIKQKSEKDRRWKEKTGWRIENKNRNKRKEKKERDKGKIEKEKKEKEKDERKKEKEKGKKEERRRERRTKIELAEADIAKTAKPTDEPQSTATAPL